MSEEERTQEENEEIEMTAERLGFSVPFALLFLMFVSAKGFGSEDPIFLDYRLVEPSGKYYVVVRRLGRPVHDATSGPVEILIVETKAGSPPPQSAQGDVQVKDAPKRMFGRVIIVKSTVGVRDGDRILGRAKLREPPRTLLISSSGLGSFVWTSTASTTL